MMMIIIIIIIIIITYLMSQQTIAELRGDLSYEDKVTKYEEDSNP